MSVENNFRSHLAKETLYAWFPANHTESTNRDPLDIYVHLGTRHPKKESALETQVLNKYHKENKRAIYKNFQTPEQAVRPPWALDVQPTPNKPIEEETDKTLLNRSKSAPAFKAPPQKPPLDIPKPIFYNLFNGEAKHIYFPHSSDNSTPTPSQSPSLEPSSEEPVRQSVDQVSIEEIPDLKEDIDFEELTPAVVETQNPGSKKPIVNLDKENTFINERKKSANLLNRPKTVNANYLSSTRDQDNFLYLKKRSQSSCSIKKPRPLGSAKSSNKEFRPQVDALSTQDLTKILRKTSASSKHSNSNSPLPISNSQLAAMPDNWKTNLFEREKHIHKRPNYFVKIDLNKLKPERAAPEVHYNAAETYFYNTMPFRKATFTIDPHFISENLNVAKIDLKTREQMAKGSPAEPVKYRRDFAFVY